MKPIGDNRWTIRGYWSTDGAVQVLGRSQEPKALCVRWPGGREEKVSLPAGAREVELNTGGQFKVHP